MKIRLLTLAIASVATLLGQYAWDFTQSPVASDSAHWQANGYETFSSSGVNFSGPGGSMIYTPAISGAAPNDYELNSTLSIGQGGGVYVLYLRANSSTVNGCSGNVSYISLEFQIAPSGPGPGPWLSTMNANRCTSGSLTTFVQVNYFLSSGSPIRALIYDGNWLNTTASGTNLCLTISSKTPTCWLIDPAPAGNPGIGGYAMPAGNGFSA